MKTSLRTEITIKELCEGFVYSELEGKGLFGLSGQLIIQPEYQRNYIYAQKGGKKEKDVIESVLKGYPIGILYFNKREDGRLEVLDGQQRITSLGRFIKDKFIVYRTAKDENNQYRQQGHYYSGLSEEERNTILQTKLLIYECEGTESEIKEWFQTINIAGVPLNNQELLNALHFGPFVTAAKTEFSNSRNAKLQKWKHYVKGNEKRQELLELALKWVSRDRISEYMSQHRQESSIDELLTHFETVIEWAESVFTEYREAMCGLEWGTLYEKYHHTPYDSREVEEKVKALDDDPCIEKKSGMFEYILGGAQDTSLLQVRVFSKAIKKAVYARQTRAAGAEGKSNCPLCVLGPEANRTKIWKEKDMEADHVTAWSRGGGTSEENCQVLCRTHNRAKGNS